MSVWYDAKLFLEHASGVSMDALHVLAGVAAQLTFAALLRVTLGSWRPWLFVLALLVLNEAGDLWVERWPQAAMQYGEAFKDIVLTMLLPSLLMLCARKTPQLFAGKNIVSVRTNPDDPH